MRKLAALCKPEFPREQLRNSRGRSGRVVGCRFVFADEKRTRADRTRLTVRPRPTFCIPVEVSGSSSCCYAGPPVGVTKVPSCSR